MKKLLLLVLALALAAPLVAAEVPPAAASAGSVPIPDVSHLSREELLAVLGNTMVGIPDPAPAQTPPCPTSVACRSPIGICGISINCTVAVLGPCCTTTSGPTLCCVSGTIKVKSCPCAGAGCPAAQISWGCA